MSETTKSDIRTVIKLAGSILVTRGYTDSATVEAVAGIALVILGWYWSRKTHKE